MCEGCKERCGGLEVLCVREVRRGVEVCGGCEEGSGGLEVRCVRDVRRGVEDWRYCV